MGLLDGKRALIFGIANDKSIAYGIAKQFYKEGAELAISYAAPAFQRRVMPIAEELKVDFVEECDLASDESIDALVSKCQKAFEHIDIIVHSVAFASREALAGRFTDTSRNDFLVAMDISVYSLIAVVKKFEHIMPEGASVVTMTYYGAQKVIPNYNVMGVAKAALESSVRYLAVDLGKNGKRINAISAGPVRTLSSAGISGFRSMHSAFGERTPLGRNIDIEDCGNLAAFLSSPLAKNITGETVFVDSGYNILGL